MANSQQIQLVSKKYIDRLTDPANPRTMYITAIKKHITVVADKLIQNVVNHSNQKFAQVATILTALPNAVADYLATGHAVQITDLVTLKPKMKVKAQSSPEACTVSTIQSVGISAQAIGKTAQLVKSWKFRQTNTVVDATGVVSAGSGSSGSGSGSAGSATADTVNVVFLYKSGRQEVLTGVVGSPLTAPTLNAEGGTCWSPVVPATFPKNSRVYREVYIEDTIRIYDFTFADGTVETVQGKEGEAVNKPENTPGYHWPDTVPSVFGSEHATFTEVADEGTGGGESGGETKYTITFTFNDGSTQTAQYKEGDTILYPANTSGYQWPDSKPATMPAQDTTVTEEEEGYGF